MPKTARSWPRIKGCDSACSAIRQAARKNTSSPSKVRAPGPLKSREEAELEVANPTDAIRLLEALGYTRLVSFQKRRETWELNGCKVELDEIPYLGKFVEIEGPSDSTVMKTRDLLKLSDRPIVKNGYISLLLSHLEENRIRQREIKFPA